MTDLLSTPRPGPAGVEHRADFDWLADEADRPTEQSLTLARDQAATLLAERGVTYGADRPDADLRWRLDPLPVIVEAGEWSRLDEALVQRAELLDAVLQDVYGARRLLRDALLPPTVVLSHAGFLRAVDGLRLPGGRELVLSATDLVRDGLGRWCAVADRTQAPSGAGYAMEDRRVVSRVLARVYRQASIQRLGPFFHALRQSLVQVAPPTDDEPRAVLLTSGPASETAFDQAYLASMLGLPLVEGEDLVVRDGRLWVQGIDGLERVDVVLRRLDADWCDPLELRTGSRLGVPGLVRVVRAGNVSLVNPLGSSVLEGPALLAYLPRLAREVLGEDLALASAPSWWCGERRSRQHVLSRLDRLVVLSTLPGTAPVPGWTLTATQRDDLAARIEAEPWAWVGQENVSPLGTGDAELDSRAAVLRSYAVAYRGAYTVMAGGLARVASGPVVSSALGAAAKDVWVLAPSQPAAGRSWDDEVLAGPVSGRPGPSGVPPRTAENLYWMGRYAERAESTARVLRAVVDRWDDYHAAPDSAGGQALDVLLQALVLRPREGDEVPTAPPPTLRELLLDAGQFRSVARSVARLGAAARAVRDQLSSDTFAPIARIERALRDERARPRPAGRAVPATLADATGPEPVSPPGTGAGALPGANSLPGVASLPGVDDTAAALAALRQGGALATSGLRPVLDRVIESLMAISGIAAEGLTRDVGWHFLDSGRRIERAQSLVDTLAVTLVDQRSPEVDELVAESVLIAHESVITYRRRHQAGPSVPAVLDLLVHDRTNPRSLAFTVDLLLADLEAVPVSWRAPDLRDHLLRDVTDLVAELDSVAAGEAVDAAGRRERLAESMESILWRLRAAHDEIDRAHFARPAPLRAQTDLWGSPNEVAS